jgi:hypothetical protein
MVQTKDNGIYLVKTTQPLEAAKVTGQAAVTQNAVFQPQTQYREADRSQQWAYEQQAVKNAVQGVNDLTKTIATVKTIQDNQYIGEADALKRVEFERYKAEAAITPLEGLDSLRESYDQRIQSINKETVGKISSFNQNKVRGDFDRQWAIHQAEVLPFDISNRRGQATQRLTNNISTDIENMGMKAMNDLSSPDPIKNMANTLRSLERSGAVYEQQMQGLVNPEEIKNVKEGYKKNALAKYLDEASYLDPDIAQVMADSDQVKKLFKNDPKQLDQINANLLKMRTTKSQVRVMNDYIANMQNNRALRDAVKVGMDPVLLNDILLTTRLYNDPQVDIFAKTQIASEGGVNFDPSGLTSYQKAEQKKLQSIQKYYNTPEGKYQQKQNEQELSAEITGLVARWNENKIPVETHWFRPDEMKPGYESEELKISQQGYNISQKLEQAAKNGHIDMQALDRLQIQLEPYISEWGLLSKQEQMRIQKQNNKESGDDWDPEDDIIQGIAKKTGWSNKEVKGLTPVRLAELTGKIMAKAGYNPKGKVSETALERFGDSGSSKAFPISAQNRLAKAHYYIIDKLNKNIEFYAEKQYEKMSDEKRWYASIKTQDGTTGYIRIPISQNEAMNEEKNIEEMQDGILQMVMESMLNDYGIQMDEKATYGQKVNAVRGLNHRLTLESDINDLIRQGDISPELIDYLTDKENDDSFTMKKKSMYKLGVPKL